MALISCKLLPLVLLAVQTAALADTRCVPDTRSITVTGTAFMEYPVRSVDIRASYTADGASPGEASRSLAATFEPLLAALEGELPEPVRLQAARLSISPQWHTVAGERSIRDYRARRGLQLVTVPVEQAGKWVERLADAGPARLALENERAGETAEPHAALTQAFANARAKAAALAEQTGGSLGAVRCVIEQSTDSPSMARQAGASAMLRANSAAPPTLRPGTVTQRARVEVVFALRSPVGPD